MGKSSQNFKLNNSGKFIGHIILPCIVKRGDKYNQMKYCWEWKISNNQPKC